MLGFLSGMGGSGLGLSSGASLNTSDQFGDTTVGGGGFRVGGGSDTPDWVWPLAVVVIVILLARR